MAVSDPIADFLTRIRNSVRAEQRFVDVNWSRMNQVLAEILQQYGFIDHYIMKKEDTVGHIRLFLKYGSKRQPVIQGLTRISKPGLRRYVGYKDLNTVHGGMGISIVSTSQGMMVGDEARKRKLGGELLCKVW